MSDKIRYIKNYTFKSFKKWKKLYGDNLVGIHVGYKTINNKKTRKYSIIFHVVRKTKHVKNQIPKFIFINIPKIGKKSVPTDVIETGRLKLAKVAPGDKAHNLSTSDYGALGLFLYDNDYYFILSNMHVLAPNVIYDLKETEYYLSPDDQIEPDIEIYNKGNNEYAYLQNAVFNVIDAGIARIDDPTIIKNSIYNYGPPAGIKLIDKNDVGLKVFMAGAKSGEQVGAVLDYEIKKSTHIPNISLDYLILTDIPITFGDSGSPVFDYELNVVGIIVAFDYEGSYVIPIDLILEYFDKSLLLN